MATEARETGVAEFKRKNASDILFSAAYTVWEEEFTRQKNATLTKKEIGENQIHAVGGIKNSYDEALRGIKKAVELGATKLIVIAEKYHATRSRMIFEALCPQYGLAVEVVSFDTPYYEMAYEPTWQPLRTVKELRSSMEFMYFLWNKMLEIPTPWVVRRIMKKETT